MHLSKPWLIIVNQQAGNGLVRKKWPALEIKLRQLLPHAKIKFSRTIEDVNHLVVDAIDQGVRHIMAVGGDGSAHHVVNAIMRQNLVPTIDITFSLLPMGTGNDWIRSHGIPQKWQEWEKAFVQGNEYLQNVGKINYHKNKGKECAYFINVAGLAYDGFVVKYATGKKSILPGKLYYLWLSISCLFRYTTQKAVLKFDDKEINQRFYTINIGIGKYSGGGMQLVPHAKTNDDAFALTYVGHLSRISVLMNSYRFYKGRIASFKKATLCKAKKIEITESNNSPIIIEADGEYLGESPVFIQLLPKALKFIGGAPLQ